MRIVEIAAVVAFLAASAGVARAAWRAAAAGRRSADVAWRPYHRYEDGRRRVYVQRGGELEPVGEVRTADPDYEDGFLALMDRARERAAVLNSEET